MFYNIKMRSVGGNGGGNVYLIILIYRGRDGVNGVNEVNGRDGNPRREA